MALAVLRALGLPTIVGLVQMAAAPGSKNVLKERSAAKKHAAAAFAEQVCVCWRQGGCVLMILGSRCTRDAVLGLEACPGTVQL